MIFLSSFVKNCLIENLSVILRNVIIRVFCNNKTKSLIMYSIKRLLCTVIATMTLTSVAAQNRYDLNEDGAVNGADVVEPMSLSCIIIYSTARLMTARLRV